MRPSQNLSHASKSFWSGNWNMQIGHDSMLIIKAFGAQRNEPNMRIDTCTSRIFALLCFKTWYITLYSTRNLRTFVRNDKWIWLPTPRSRQWPLSTFSVWTMCEKLFTTKHLTKHFGKPSSKYGHENKSPCCLPNFGYKACPSTHLTTHRLQRHLVGIIVY